MLIAEQTARFRRDLKKIRKRGLPRSKLDAVVEKLVMEEPLGIKYHDHALTGNWVGHRECHLAPDWLLIYRVTGDTLQLIRTGSHADLFE